jgi:methionine-rich copper-binding protein CopC
VPTHQAYQATTRFGAAGTTFCVERVASGRIIHSATGLRIDNTGFRGKPVGVQRKRNGMAHRDSNARVLARLLLVGSLVASFVLGWMLTPTTAAKAEFARSEPADGATLKQAPTTVELWFNEELAPERTWIVVIGPDGARVDLGDAAIDPANPDHRHVTVSLRAALPAGPYVAHWNADSAVEEKQSFGHIAFELTEEAATCSAAAGTAVAASPVSRMCAAPPSQGTLGEPLTVGDVTIDLEAGGTDAGPIDLTVMLTDATGAPITEALVSVRARHLDMDHGEFPKVSTPDGAGAYVAKEVGMGMGGSWRVAVDVIRPGADPITAFFLIDLTGLA